MSAPTPAQLFAIATQQPIPNAEKIIAFLSSRTSTKTDRHILAAFFNAAGAISALPAYKFITDADIAKQHCVRCHGPFTPGDGDPCNIPHSFNEEGREGDRYPSICCGRSVELEEEGSGNDHWTNLHEFGFCFLGRHTTDVNEVKRQHNGANIFPCEIGVKSGRCIRPWVDEGRNPVFSWQFEIDPEVGFLWLLFRPYANVYVV